jgi:hypothetical protein
VRIFILLYSTIAGERLQEKTYLLYFSSKFLYDKIEETKKDFKGEVYERIFEKNRKAALGAGNSLCL